MTRKSYSGQALQMALLFIVIALCSNVHCKPSYNIAKNVTVPEFEEILEYHFHTYFDAKNPEEVAHAIELRNEIISNCVLNKVVAIPWGYHYDPENPVLEHNNDTTGLAMKPVGPHPVPQFETWVPIEYFDEMYAWFLQKRSILTIFIHPLTKHPLADHTIRIVFMGKSYTLNADRMPEFDHHFTSQYEYLKLGYAKPKQ